MWKEALDFDMHVKASRHAGEGAGRGKDFQRPRVDSSASSNVGLDDNWFGNHCRRRICTASDGWRGIPI